MSATIAPTQEIIDQFVGNAHGNISVVRALISQYPSIVAANASWNETAIQAAAQTGQVEIVNYLLQQGAEYDICTAAMLGSRECIEDYLQEDAGLINGRGAHGIPIMYFPAIRGNIEIADFLLTQGADVNAASPDGITALYGTVMFKQPNMAAWLLEHGADPNPKYDGKTPLAMALENKQDELAEILRQHGGRE